MTVYNVNLGIGWASSGVEYAQKYRSDIFKRIGVNAKFIFSDMILGNNINDLTRNIGFEDNQIIWLYNFFTDIKIAPSTYRIDQLEKDLNIKNRNVSFKKVIDNQIVYVLNDEELSIVARFNKKDKQTIDQVTYLRNNQILHRDFYSYVKYAREYYVGTKDNYVFSREFYNEDGSTAYVQYLNNGKETFEFPNHRFFYSKNELYLEMLKELKFSKDDVIILDREDEDKNLINGQLIFENHQSAKLIVVVHADHYDKHFTSDNHILWNNFYEYQFTHSDEVDAFVVATPKQQQLLAQQLKQYFDKDARVDSIPVGNLKRLHPVSVEVKPYSIITASRLANEKHIDWLIKAVIEAKKEVPEINLDIYGKGSEAGRLQDLINKNGAQNYIRLMGQHDLTDIYAKYSAYVAASTSEGFGLSLMEAVGSGLPMIGFDVPYGNPTFIDDGQNGYLLPYDPDWTDAKKYIELKNAIIKLFSNNDLNEFRSHSYMIASKYLIDKVANKWKQELEDL